MTRVNKTLGGWKPKANTLVVADRALIKLYWIVESLNFSIKIAQIYFCRLFNKSAADGKLLQRKLFPNALMHMMHLIKLFVNMFTSPSFVTYRQPPSPPTQSVNIKVNYVCITNSLRGAFNFSLLSKRFVSSQSTLLSNVSTFARSFRVMLNDTR